MKRFASLIFIVLAGCASLPPAPARYEIVGYYPG